MAGCRAHLLTQLARSALAQARGGAAPKAGAFGGSITTPDESITTPDEGRAGHARDEIGEL